MSAGAELRLVLDALGLPAEAGVGARIPKKTLLENTRFAAADRRALNEGIDELRWVAKLAPSTAGIAAGRYSEVQVFALTAKAGANVARVVGLVHRGPAYPILLATATAQGILVSAAHVRPAENDASRTVAEDVHVTEAFDPASQEPAVRGFLASLALAAIRPASLDALVDAWISRVGSLGACRLAGAWVPRPDGKNGRALHELHGRYLELSAELERLTRAGAHERQMNRLVDVNLERRRLDAERRQVLGRMAAVARGAAPDSQQPVLDPHGTAC